MNDSTETNVWTNLDQQAAIRRGWGVYEIWDIDKRRTDYEIQCSAEGVGFLPSDEAARALVLKLVQAGDPLAQKAARVVFISKVKGIPKRKKK